MPTTWRWASDQHGSHSQNSALTPIMSEWEWRVGGSIKRYITPTQVSVTNFESLVCSRWPNPLLGPPPASLFLTHLCCCGHHWIHDRPSPSPLSSTLIGLTYKVTYKAIDFFFKNFFKNGPNGKDNYLIWCKKRIKICMVEKKSRFFLFF
jgi:hypothetical protein